MKRPAEVEREALQKRGTELLVEMLKIKEELDKIDGPEQQQKEPTVAEKQLMVGAGVSTVKTAFADALTQIREAERRPLAAEVEALLGPFVGRFLKRFEGLVTDEVVLESFPSWREAIRQVVSAGLVILEAAPVLESKRTTIGTAQFKDGDVVK